MKKFGMILIMVTAIASAAIAGGPSSERGKELFASTTLGTNGKSCASCHSGGKNLVEAAAYEDEQLGKIVNQCIKKALEGIPLDPASDDMKSFIMYIKSFAVAKKL